MGFPPACLPALSPFSANWKPLSLSRLRGRMKKRNNGIENGGPWFVHFISSIWEEKLKRKRERASADCWISWVKNPYYQMGMVVLWIRMWLVGVGHRLFVRLYGRTRVESCTLLAGDPPTLKSKQNRKRRISFRFSWVFRKMGKERVSRHKGQSNREVSGNPLSQLQTETFTQSPYSLFTTTITKHQNTRNWKNGEGKEKASPSIRMYHRPMECKRITLIRLLLSFLACWFCSSHF